MKKRINRTSETKQGKSSARSNRRRSAMTNGNEVEYDFPTSTETDDKAKLAALIRLIPTNFPSLSNFEQKQIVEGLLNHPKGMDLTFDEAQNFAIEKAIGIGKTNRFLFSFLSDISF